MTQSKQISMQDLLEKTKEEIKVLEPGDMVEGEVLAVTKNGIWLDLGPYGTGLVVGVEVSDPRFRANLKIGDKLQASVIEQEFDNGEVLLSLRKVTKEKAWDKLIRYKESGESMIVKPYEANRGGLMIEVDGVRGFLPVSQLTAEHYPRVTDKDEILIRLNQLVKKPLEVCVLDVDRGENKVIFSERMAKREQIEEKLKKFKVGDKVRGKVTGVADFGIFMDIDGIEGMVHISEISWDKVEDPSTYVKIGEEIDVQIIGIEDDRLSLSMKKLKDDPWVELVKKIKIGDKVKGEVTRLMPFGAFVKILGNIEALVHISELSNDRISDPSEVVEVGNSYDFKVLFIDIDNHRLALTLREDIEETKKTKKKSTSVQKEEKVSKTKDEKTAISKKVEKKKKDGDV